MFTLANVRKVYSGRHGCMCGCRGKYSYAAGCAESQYDEVNERSVKILFNKVMNNPARKVEDGIAFVDTDTRSLVVYFKD